MERNTKLILIFLFFIVLLMAFMIYSTVLKNTEIFQNISKGLNPARGDINSENVIIEFGDFRCLACKSAHPIIDEILKEYNVSLYYRNFPLPMHGEISFLASEAAECANEQEKFWEYHDILYDNQELWTTKEDLKEYAFDLGLNTNKFNECLDSEKYKAEIKKDIKDAKELNVQGTPTFFINGQRVFGADKEKIISYIKNG